MTDTTKLAERIEAIKLIEKDLLSMGNDRAQVKAMAKAARQLRVGQPVESTTHNVKGVVGYAVTETLGVAITGPDNLHGAHFFAHPLHLRAREAHNG